MLILGQFTGFDWDESNRGKNWRLHQVSDVISARDMTKLERVFYPR